MMFQQIVKCAFKQLGIIAEHAEARIVFMAQQAAYFAGFMIVIDRKDFHWLSAHGRLLANCAQSVLQFKQAIVINLRDFIFGLENRVADTRLPFFDRPFLARLKAVFFPRPQSGICSQPLAVFGLISTLIFFKFRGLAALSFLGKFALSLFRRELYMLALIASTRFTVERIVKNTASLIRYAVKVAPKGFGVVARSAHSVLYNRISQGVNLHDRFASWLGSFGVSALFEPFTFYHSESLRG